MKQTITIDLEYAKDILQVLENGVSCGFAMVSQEIKNLVSKEAYNELVEIHLKYHNANCGPFNRNLKRLIEEASF